MYGIHQALVLKLFSRLKLDLSHFIVHVFFKSNQESIFFLHRDYYLALCISFLNDFYNISPQFPLLPEDVL